MPKRQYYNINQMPAIDPSKSEADKKRSDEILEQCKGSVTSIIRFQKLWREKGPIIKNKSKQKAANNRKELFTHLFKGGVILLATTSEKNLTEIKKINSSYDTIIQDWWYSQRVHFVLAWLDPSLNESMLYNYLSKHQSWSGDQDLLDDLSNVLQVSSTPLVAARERSNQYNPKITSLIADIDKKSLLNFEEFRKLSIEGSCIPIEMLSRADVSEANEKMQRVIENAYKQHGFHYSFDPSEPNSACCQFFIKKIFDYSGVDSKQIELPPNAIVISFEKEVDLHEETMELKTNHISQP